MEGIVAQSAERQVALVKFINELPSILPLEPLKKGRDEVAEAEIALDDATQKWENSKPQGKEAGRMLQCINRLEFVKKEHEKQCQEWESLFFGKLVEVFGEEAFWYFYEKWLESKNDQVTQRATNSSRSPTPPGTNSRSEPNILAQSLENESKTSQNKDK
ncbi:hypothetical protein FBEOM_3801 [Fusarium beomiforme]|uniref:Uncharacterized protein n=1 Tax=Fusarium beomiforme TaxID=44412 RepID=A0A9P5APA0_9HYPO|nr:hypothetical protein FBEOM_3801 [Fusarium beomiforme]